VPVQGTGRSSGLFVYVIKNVFGGDRLDVTPLKCIQALFRKTKACVALSLFVRTCLDALAGNSGMFLSFLGLEC
jgi:hypothetical protein